MKKTLTLLALVTMTTALAAQKTVQLTVSNPNNTPLKQWPVVVDLRAIAGENHHATAALVTINGVETPCQMDDLNGDGQNDELVFLADFTKKGKLTATLQLESGVPPRHYEPQVYAELMLTNKKIKEQNQQNLYISELTVDRGVNPYWMLHHHGAAFENRLVAYRIYFDQRQTVDIYGKYREQLELRQTQFYPDDAQKAAGFGDDVLWVGQTFGLGTLRGWDGTKPTMLDSVDHRGQKIVARGPLRTIVEVKDQGWTPLPGLQPVDMVTRYTLYANRRDCQVDVWFALASPLPAPRSSLTEQPDWAGPLSNGLINIKNSTHFTDHNGLRGCWGTDWPVSAKDSVGHKRETVGLGIFVPQDQLTQWEEQTDNANYTNIFSVKTTSSPRSSLPSPPISNSSFLIPNPPLHHLIYYITFSGDNESFGFHSPEAWFDYLKSLRKERELKPLKIRNQELEIRNWPDFEN